MLAFEASVSAALENQDNLKHGGKPCQIQLRWLLSSLLQQREECLHPTRAALGIAPNSSSIISTSIFIMAQRAFVYRRRKATISWNISLPILRVDATLKISLPLSVNPTAKPKMVTRRYCLVPLIFDALIRWTFNGINDVRTEIGHFLNIYIEVQSRSVRAAVNFCTKLSQKATMAPVQIRWGNRYFRPWCSGCFPLLGMVGNHHGKWYYPRGRSNGRRSTKTTQRINGYGLCGVAPNFTYSSQNACWGRS